MKCTKAALLRFIILIGWGPNSSVSYALKPPQPLLLFSFDGTVQIRYVGDEDWVDVPHAFVEGYGRSVGVADMAYAIRSGRAHRASGEQAFAVLDIMQGFLESSETGRCVTPASTYERPSPMPAELPFGELDG